MRTPILLLSSAAALSLCSVNVSARTEIQLFPPESVKLLDGPFRNSLELNGAYLMQHEPDRFLAPFLIDAGLEPKAEGYGNWESSGLNGHSCGHYLSALALMYSNTGDSVYKERLDYMISELARCQAANGDGYVGGVPDAKPLWEAVRRGEIKAERFSLNGRWVPWYNIHKTFVGLKDAWLVAGNEQARETLLALCDWAEELTQDLPEEKMQSMLYAEHGGMNEVFAEVYQETNDSRYLALAKRFSHKEILDPLSRGEDPLTGMHANTQIPKVIGFQRIANATEAPEFDAAANFFWENVVHERSVVFGGNSVREHFHDPDDFQTMLESREGPESCNTYNMLRLSAQRFLDSPDSATIDYYERALFNHILSVQNPTTGGYVYFTPIRPRHYRVYSQAESAFWCCVGSGMENPGRYTELIYAHGDDSLFVNLFIPSSLDWPERKAQLMQKTDFPRSDETTLALKLEKPTRFSLLVRRPSWTGDDMRLELNGKPLSIEAGPNGYFRIDRKWKNGDTLKLVAPMSLHAERLPDDSDYYAFLYGPIALAARNGDSDTPGLFAGDGRMEHIAPGPYYPLQSAATLITDPKELGSLLQPVPNDPLHFRYIGTAKPTPDHPIVLEPFNQIHGERYTLYWQTLDESRYESAIKELEAEQALKQKRLERLVDQVLPGQQQPEVEHGYRGEQSRSGNLLGRTFREASHFFEYTLRADELRDLEIGITYWGSEWGRACAVSINGEELGRIVARSNQPERFVEQTFPIPAELLAKAEDGQLVLRLTAIDQQTTPSIFEVALLRSDP